MKYLFYLSAIFFLIFTVSHGLRFDIITPENHHDHLIESSSNGGDSLIRLPEETVASKQQSQLETTTASIDVGPVLLPNRFRFPRRCRHGFRRFGPGIQVGPKDDVASIFKKRAEAVILHRHVAGGEFGGVEGEFLIVPVKHLHKMRLDHHVHDHHHEVVDPTVDMMKTEENEVKLEYDHDHHHRHHHRRHDHHNEKEENGIMNKIRKFLPLF
ncbi:hypothetical protein vseg_020168 [Gypsophila vaccaria]